MNLFYCCLLLSNILIVLAKPDQINQQNPDEVPAFCSSQECLYFKDRLDTLEAVVQKMANVLSSQKSPIFAPISRMLELDPTIKLILSRSTTFPPNSTISATDSFTFNSTTEKDAQPAEESSFDNEKEMTVGDLKAALKCSLANLVDISYDRQIVNLSAPITVSFLADNDSLEIEFFPSTECIQFSSGVWIQVFQFGDEHKSSPETSLSIPLECLEISSENSFSITLLPPTSLFDNKNDTCRFLLNRNLVQCQSYIVEVIPNYQSFRGNIMRKEIVIQPKKIDESSMKSLVSIVAQSDSLMLNWKDNTGCAPQMTSFDLKIFPDGIVNKSGQENKTIRVPSSCLKRTMNEENLFSFTLPTNSRTCSVDWEPLDKCRKYGFEMNSQYSDTWNGPSSSWEIFTGQDEGNETTTAVDYWGSCLENQYYCPSPLGCQDNSWLCDHNHDCHDGRDEIKYCDYYGSCISGFKCGRQCIPRELVCDGKVDCMDLSDEGYSCNYKQICYQLTNPSGRFTSQILVEQASEQANVQVKSRFIRRPTRKITVLISVKPNYQIWLSFDKFNTNTGEAVKVYDGPYSSSPLLLSHNGSTLPLPIRSSSNDLFIEFPSYQNENLGFVSVYTSVIRTEEPYVPGCGGYVSGRGNISTPNYSLIYSEISDCVWFIETSLSENTILLRRNYSLDNQRPPAVAIISRLAQPPMIVYDGWNESGQVLYDSKEPDSQDKLVVFSISNKIMVQFKTPIVKENFNFSWNVSQISTTQCKHFLEATSGTIKSPEFPMHYPHMTECRWNIKVKEGSTIRLLFAFFETQDGADIVQVFDGPSVYSKLLFAKSGSVSAAFVVNSSTNQVLIRFNSDDSVSFSGFLTLYSSV